MIPDCHDLVWRDSQCPVQSESVLEPRRAYPVLSREVRREGQREP